MGGFKSNSKAWLAEETRVLDRAEAAMMQVMKHRVIAISPVKSGDLVEDIRVVKNPSGGRSLISGSPKVPYGRIQELGGMTGREYKTKIVGTHHVQRGGDSVAKENIKKYVDISR